MKILDKEILRFSCCGFDMPVFMSRNHPVDNNVKFGSKYRFKVVYYLISFVVVENSFLIFEHIKLYAKLLDYLRILIFYKSDINQLLSCSHGENPTQLLDSMGGKHSINQLGHKRLSD